MDYHAATSVCETINGCSNSGGGLDLLFSFAVVVADGLRQLFSIHLLALRPGAQSSIVRKVMVGDTQLWKGLIYICFLAKLE